ncbi:MAG TPA: histidinol-phosphate transaminase [Methanomicrobiales archaeon]|nr:histidinol-phosphate transaminase [Methanomicrobiales archaeon]
MGAKKHLAGIERTPADRTDRIRWIRLDKNECTLELPPEVLDEIRSRIDPEFLACYPEVYQLYDALSAHLRLPSEELLVTAGSDGAIRAAYDSFVEPGGEVVNLQPNFAMYDVYTRLYRGNPVDVYYHPETLALDLPAVLAAIGPRTSLVVLSNPNSPTGTEIPQEAVAAIAREAARHGATVLVDEAYHPFSPATSLPLLSRFENLLVVRSLSKAFGLASARVGFAAGNPALIRAMGAFRPIYEVTSYGVLCATTILGRYDLVEQAVARILGAKEWFAGRCRDTGIGVLPGAANFVNVMVGPGEPSRYVRLCRDAGILIREGYPWGILADCIRVSVGREEHMESLHEVIRRGRDQGAMR